jgi:hypothetical protein
MNANKLKLNGEKTEVIFIGTRPQLQKIAFNSITVAEANITSHATVKNLGVFIDSDLKMKSQVNHVARTCYKNIHMLRKFKNYLPEHALHTLVQAFVISRLDYANALYYGIPEYLLDRLQRVQNMAARLICNLKTSDHITPALMHLHWLPIRQRIAFKIAVVTYKCLHNTAPIYLKDLLSYSEPIQSLRSSSTRPLRAPITRLKFAGDRSFSAAAPTIWNKLPTNVRETENLVVFKSKLKCFLFNEAYEQYS